MRKGFTLIELLVVITILAVLAGAALPYVQNYVEESRIAKAKTDLEEIARALAVYETREGEYSKPDVGDLTGRYLNKSPIDPWGSSYVVSPERGTVYSLGPDRSGVDADPDQDKFDNISVPYQPPLALVSAKWVDKNQSGAVDIQNVSDELHLSFSRKLGSGVTIGDIGLYIYLNAVTPLHPTLVGVATPYDPKLVGSSRVLIYKVAKDRAFTLGGDYVIVTGSHNTIFDQSPDKNYCLSSQNVTILPQ